MHVPILGNLPTKGDFTLCYTNITLYHVIYSFRYYPRFHVTSDNTEIFTRGYEVRLYYSGDQIKNNEVSWACGMYGRQERCTQGFGGKNWKRQFKRPRVDGMTILKLISKKWDEDMNCIGLAHDRDRWRAVVNAEMNLRVPRNAGISWLVRDF